MVDAILKFPISNQIKWNLIYYLFIYFYIYLCLKIRTKSSGTHLYTLDSISGVLVSILSKVPNNPKHCRIIRIDNYKSLTLTSLEPTINQFWSLDFKHPLLFFCCCTSRSSSAWVPLRISVCLSVLPLPATASSSIPFSSSS